MNASLKQFICVVPLSMMLLMGISYAGSDTQIDRYLTVPNQPLIAQTDLLSQTRQVTFPNSIHTIGDAINYLLLFSGYSLAPFSKANSKANSKTNSKTNCAVRAMLNASLPEVDRQFGPMKLSDGLQTLSGDSFVLLIDPIHRFISFKLKTSSLAIYKKRQSVQDNHNFLRIFKKND